MSAELGAAGVDLALLEQRTAERDAAEKLLDRLERAYPPGFATSDVQTLLREVRMHLELRGKRPRTSSCTPAEPAPWQLEPAPWKR